jgi:hypothetical protein
MTLWLLLLVITKVKKHGILASFSGVVSSKYDDLIFVSTSLETITMLVIIYFIQFQRLFILLTKNFESAIPKTANPN